MSLQRTVVLLRRVDCMFSGLLRIARTLSLRPQVVFIMSTTVSIEGVCVITCSDLRSHCWARDENRKTLCEEGAQTNTTTCPKHPRPLPLWKLLFQGHLCLTEPKRLWVSCCYLNNATYLSPLIYSYILCGGFWVCDEMKAPKLYCM